MIASPEIEAQGLQAYERALAYERLRTWRLPAIYVACTVVPLVCGVALWWMEHPYWALSQIAFALFFVGSAYFHWRKLATEYAANVLLLAELEKTYGHDLPWIKMEKHFAELRQLESDIAREKAPR